MTTEMTNYGPTFARLCDDYLREVKKVVVGCDEPLRLALIAMFSDGHLIYESVPGLGKSTIALTLGRAIKDGVAGVFQGTADLLPMDIIGSKAWNPETRKLEIQHGAVKPEFNVVLADETNRLAPKTASSLLMVMQERVLNIQGEEYPMADPFLVLGTQNPIEQEGTYPMPEALLDRFALMGRLSYPSRAEEIELSRRKAVYARNQQDAAGVQPVLSIEDMKRMRSFAQDTVDVSETMSGYIIDLVRATRPECPEEFNLLPEEARKSIRLGASSRGVLWLTACSKVAAAMKGRNVVLAEDIQSLVPAVLGHRIMLTSDAEFKAGGNVNGLIDDICAAVLDSVPNVRED